MKGIGLMVSGLMVASLFATNVISAPLSEGFEMGLVPPFGWTVLDEDGDGHSWSPRKSAFFAHSGEYSARVRWNSAGNDDWLITPQLEVSAGDSFSFWSRSHSTWSLESFEVWLSTTGTAVGDFTVLLGTEIDIPASYNQYLYPLDAYAGTNVYIAIRCISVNEFYLYVDDVEGPEALLPPLPPSSGLVINEIMQNPAAVWDSRGEWIEIYSDTSVEIDINGWIIKDADWDFHVIDNGAPLIVPAYGYLVIGRNADTLINGGVHLDYVATAEFSLDNGADEVILMNNAGIVVDSVYYDGGPEFPDPSGASMELIDPSLDNMVGANWHTAYLVYGDGDFGTPGEKNSPPDPSEPNNILADAFPIDSGDIYDCWIYPGGAWGVPGDLDYFTFDGGSGDSVHIYITPLLPDTLDVAVALMDDAGNVIARADAYFAGDPEYIGTTLPYEGTFYILVAYWGDVPYTKKALKSRFREGPYSIEFIRTPPPFLDHDAAISGLPNEGDPDTLTAPAVFEPFVTVFNNSPPGSPIILSFRVHYKVSDETGNIVGSKQVNVWNITAQEYRTIHFGSIPLLPGIYTAAVTIQTIYDPDPLNNFITRTFVVESAKMGTEDVPKVFALHRAQPNPVRGDAVISYQLPNKVDVSLKIYDVSGRMVTSLVDGTEPAGYYNVRWNPPGAGVYFVKLTAGDFRATRRIVVLK